VKDGFEPVGLFYHRVKEYRMCFKVISIKTQYDVCISNINVERKRREKMSLEKRILALLPIFVGFLVLGADTSIHPLTDAERMLLYTSIEGQSWADMTIDVSFTKQVVTKPEAVNRIRYAATEQFKNLSNKSGKLLEFSSYGLALPDGSEMLLSETRTRIGCGLKLRNDTTIFANKEKTETKYEATTINTVFGKDSPSYHIEHKSKQALIWSGRQWSGLEILRFGKVDDAIVLDVLALCNPSQSQNIKEYRRKKDFLHKGTNTVDGKAVDEIECVDLENSKVIYNISLDPNDWRICRKIVWYDSKSGLVSKIVEYKEFAKAQETGELFPLLIIRKYFDKEGREEKLETINISNVVTGLPISEDIFRLDVPNEYTIIDNRSSPPLTIQPR
jgi:hypothetical protein